MSSFVRRALVLPALAVALCAAPGSALVTQPNGQVMPLNSNNGEEQLFTFFSNRGEAIDWQADGRTEPATFSPLCDFKATFLLHEAGSSFDVGWYNTDPNNGTPPTAANVHVVVPAGTALGQTITGASIRNDPAYAGGLVGFALKAGQLHTTEQRFNPVCTGCNPAGPWVSAVIYASKNIPNAYYIAFEDGNMGANPGSFGNDGDYNDDVFLFEGLVCAGGGDPCDTGVPGICAQGATGCNGQGCNQLVAPGTEACNGLDDDCNGSTDEGDLCPTNFICDRGTCVERCGGGEFVCSGNLVCSNGFCVEQDCATVTCPSGQICQHGTCKAPCDGVACPVGQVCRAGRCADPCDGVTCPSEQVCMGGVCKTPCTCAPCAAGLECQASTGVCKEAGCANTSCGPTEACVAGQCVDACTGAVCPSGQKCEAGDCVDDPTASGGAGGAGADGGATGGTGNIFGSGGSAAASSGGTAASAQGGSSASSSGGSSGAAGSAFGKTSSAEPAGCGCRVPARRADSAAWLAALAGLGAAVLRRRARRVSGT